MSFKDCVSSLVRQGHLTSEEGDRLYRQYDSYHGLPPGEIKNRMIAWMQAQEAEKERVAGLTLVAKNNIIARIESHRNARGLAAPAEALWMLIESFGQMKGQDIENLRLAILGRGAHAKLEELLYEFRKGAISGELRRNRPEQVARLDNIVRELFGENTGDARAKELAAAWTEVADQLRKRFNQAGGAIRKLEKWGLPQVHDQLRIIEAGKEAWKNYITPLLDREKTRHALTGAKMTERELGDALDHVYETIATDGWNARDPSLQPEGMSALYKQHSDHRFLHFKDADSWMRYQREFGEADAYASMMGHISMMSRDIAAMEILGPNPELMLNFLKGYVTKKNPGTPETVKALHRLDAMWAHYKGSANTPVSGRGANVVATVRNLISASSLGMASISSLGDIGTSAVARKFIGMPGSKAISAYFSQMGTEATRHAVRAGLILESAIHTMHQHARYIGSISGKSWSAYVNDRVLTYNGMQPMTRMGKHAFGMELQAHVADHAHLSWDELHTHPDGGGEAVRRMLERHGITPDDWELMRRANHYTPDRDGGAVRPPEPPRPPQSPPRAPPPDAPRAPPAPEPAAAPAPERRATAAQPLDPGTTYDWARDDWARNTELAALVPKADVPPPALDADLGSLLPGQLAAWLERWGDLPKTQLNVLNKRAPEFTELAASKGYEATGHLPLGPVQAEREHWYRVNQARATQRWQQAGAIDAVDLSPKQVDTVATNIDHLVERMLALFHYSRPDGGLAQGRALMDLARQQLDAFLGGGELPKLELPKLTEADKKRIKEVWKDHAEQRKAPDGGSAEQLLANIEAHFQSAAYEAAMGADRYSNTNTRNHLVSLLSDLDALRAAKSAPDALRAGPEAAPEVRAPEPAAAAAPRKAQAPVTPERLKQFAANTDALLETLAAIAKRDTAEFSASTTRLYADALQQQLDAIRDGAGLPTELPKLERAKPKRGATQAPPKKFDGDLERLDRSLANIDAHFGTLAIEGGKDMAYFSPNTVRRTVSRLQKELDVLRNGAEPEKLYGAEGQRAAALRRMGVVAPEPVAQPEPVKAVDPNLSRLNRSLRAVGDIIESQSTIATKGKLNFGPDPVRDLKRYVKAMRDGTELPSVSTHTTHTSYLNRRRRPTRPDAKIVDWNPERSNAFWANMGALTEALEGADPKTTQRLTDLAKRQVDAMYAGRELPTLSDEVGARAAELKTQAKPDQAPPDDLMADSPEHPPSPPSEPPRDQVGSLPWSRDHSRRAPESLGLLRPQEVADGVRRQLAAQGMDEATASARAEKLADLYLTMILRETRYAIPESTIAGRAAMVGTNQPGTFIGELVRSGGQFKSFPVSFATLHGGRVMSEVAGGHYARGAAYAGGLLIVSTLLGAAAMQLKAIAKGDDPRSMEPIDAKGAKFWGAAMLQGGGLGIFGDFLFAEMARTGSGLSATIAGPMVERIDALRRLTIGNFLQMSTDEKTNFGREFTDILRKNMPGNNLPFAYIIWNRLVMDQLQFLMDADAHGAFRRQRQHKQRDYSQQSWWAPGKDLERGPDLSRVWPN